MRWNKQNAALRGTMTRGFTLIQLLGALCILLGLFSITRASIKAVADRSKEASEAQKKMLAPALEQISGSVSNHNDVARQADRALEMIK